MSQTVNLTLRGGRVTTGFRAALFAAAGRAGMSINEYVLWSVGERLARSAIGANVDGVFSPGDLAAGRDQFNSPSGLAN